MLTIQSKKGYFGNARPKVYHFASSPSRICSLGQAGWRFSINKIPLLLEVRLPALQPN